jgi:hypothetical protein
MQPNSESLIDTWSDKQLLARYRDAFLDRGSRDFGPRPHITDIEEEIRRRGLVVSDRGEPNFEPPITPG